MIEKIPFPCYTYLKSLKGSDNIRRTTNLTLAVFCVNILLFALKLYVGLSSNSISIYSDGINNFFDSLMGLLSFVCFSFAAKKESIVASFNARKTEELLTFIMSVIVGITGFYFMYSSLERLTYPTPVWYKTKYLYLIVFTALVKIAMFLFLNFFGKKMASSVIKVMAFDSLLDFFVTGTTALTLVVSKFSNYSVDAFCGIFISTVIIVCAVKMIVSSGKILLGYVPSDKRQMLESLLKDSGAVKIDIIKTREETTAYILCEEEKDFSLLKNKIVNETGITPVFYRSKENKK